MEAPFSQGVTGGCQGHTGCGGSHFPCCCSAAPQAVQDWALKPSAYKSLGINIIFAACRTCVCMVCTCIELINVKKLAVRRTGIAYPQFLIICIRLTFAVSAFIKFYIRTREVLLCYFMPRHVDPAQSFLLGRRSNTILKDSIQDSKLQTIDTMRKKCLTGLQSCIQLETQSKIIISLKDAWLWRGEGKKGQTNQEAEAWPKWQCSQ